MVPLVGSPAARTSPTWTVPLVLLAEPLPPPIVVSPTVTPTWPLDVVLSPPALTLTPGLLPTLTPTGVVLPPPDGEVTVTTPLLPPAVALPAGVVTVTPPPPLVGEVVVLPPAGCVDGLVGVGVGAGLGCVTGVVIWLTTPSTGVFGAVTGFGTDGGLGSCARATAGTAAPPIVHASAATALPRFRGLRAPPTFSVTKSLSTFAANGIQPLSGGQELYRLRQIWQTTMLRRRWTPTNIGR